MKHISKYIFSIFLIVISLSIEAQTTKKENLDEKKKDSIVPKFDRYGLRVGIDLFKISKSVYDKNYKGLELIGDFRLDKRHYLAVELGNENKTTDDTRLNFTTKGTYIKVGFDFNSYENWLNMENMVYVGLRYGISSFSQQLNSFKIYNTSNFFNENNVFSSSNQYDGLSAQWLEFVAGIKAEVFKNTFVGFSFRLNKLVTNKRPDGFDNLYIPGFNRTYDGTFGIGFNYTVSYFLPIYKKKLITKTNVKKEEIKK